MAERRENPAQGQARSLVRPPSGCWAVGDVTSQLGSNLGGEGGEGGEALGSQGRGCKEGWGWERWEARPLNLPHEVLILMMFPEISEGFT